MAFLATSYLLAGASRLPLILLSSPPLRQCSSLFLADAQQTLKPSAIEHELRNPVPTVSKKSNGAAPVSYAQQNEIKRRGFNAIIRWCAYHQEREGLALAQTADTTEEITGMDSSVLRWVQESVSSFSCGQCLIVLTFLCDVLGHQRSEGSMNPSTEALSSEFVRGLCRCISLLTARSASSEQLEIQPFLILLSAAYGLHRVTHNNPLKLSPETVASLSPPPALWLALVHQVNLFCTSTAEAQPSMLERTAIEALLTTLLLFDPVRCQQLLAAQDRFLMATVAKRLDALITPALNAARQERKSAAIAAASADSYLNAEVAPESRSPRGVDENAAMSAAAASFSVSPVGVTSSICLADFARIISHAHGAPPTCRVNLMEYLLCVLRHPSTFTAEERRCLPAIMSAVRSRNLCRLSSVPDYILKFSATMEFDVLAEVLCYTRRTSQYRERIHQMLCHCFQRDDGADDLPEPKLAPHVALSLLLSFGLQLPWTLCRPLLLCNLAVAPEVLTKMQTTAGEGGANSVAVQSADKPPSAKVPLSLDLCAIFYFLAKCHQSLDSGGHSAEAAPEVRAEILQLTRALVCSIDWKGCTEKSLTESTRSKGNYTMISVATISALSAYVEGRLTHQYLSADDAMDENVLFNVFVLPIVRVRTHQRIKIESLPVLAKTVRLLTTDELKRRLVTHMIRLTSEGSFYNFFAFVRFVAPLAIEFKVATTEHTALVFRQRTLSIRGAAGRILRHANALKVHTTMLLRTVRYVLAIGALDGGNAAVSAARRETVRVWFENYLHRLAAAEKTSKNSLPAADSVTEAAEPPHPGGTTDVETIAEEEQPTAEDEGAPAAGKSNEDDFEDGDNAPDEQKVDADDADIAHDAAFATPVTDADVEEVLSLMLRVGCRQPYRVMLPIARRMAERTPIIAEDIVSSSWCTPAPAGAADGNAKVSTQTSTWAAHAMNGGSIAATDEDDECLGLLNVSPLAAHFVYSVRMDFSIELPALFPAFLRALLASCDIRIFHHVVFAFLMAVKRRRTVPVLSEDLQIGIIAFATLQRRLAMGQIEDSQERSAAVSKSIASFLNHLALALPHLRAAQLKFLSAYVRRGDASAGTSNEPTLTQLDCATSLSMELQGVAPQANVEPDDEDDASDEKDGFESHVATHAKLETCLLQLIPYLEAAELKQLGLAHMQRLSVFFPHVSAFVVQQLQPQLSDFSQRELLQLVAQYPGGAAEVLTLLSTTDMRATVDLNDYVTIAKRLPMQISEAIVSAHLPHMTIAWVARVLSALAVRHEDVPLPLLRSLLDRVSAVAEDTSESDKSLLMMILQGYLFFRTDRGSLAELRPERKPATGESSVSVIDDLLWALTSTTHIVGEAEQHERRELIRACCDRLLSLEHIFTLEELRRFLVSYPTSLHRMREQGVVTKVEQQLLPNILATTPLPWRELAALVHLLADHRVLLPSTVAIILESVFTEAQLASLHEAVVMTSDSDIVSTLVALLRIATKCAEVTAPGYPPFPLLQVTELVLSIFNGVQHWLAAVAELAIATTSSLSAAEETASRHVCRMLLNRSSDLNPSEFARLVHGISRLKAWDLMVPKSKPSPSDAFTPAVAAADVTVTFERTLALCYERADAHSRCVLLKAIAMDTAVLRRFEAVVFAPIQTNIPLLPSEDLELVLTAALQVSNEAIVEPVLDAIDTRMLPMLDQCRRSAIVRLVQCHAHFNINDEIVVTAALQALERQASTEVKLDVPQLLSVLQAVASLTVSQVPERLLVLCFQRLEKMAASLTPLQQYQVGRLILDLEMGYSSSVSALVLHILDSRDGARGHKQFQAMTEELCDAFEVELPTQLRASRQRKVRSKRRVIDFWSAQRKVKQEAMLHRC
ncbi:conserved hypothetical protein [Leishmania major strain Friedlin]|uniref:Uncharacterized protein n=1 Tax=Leishmania major TaxID=5664 RepID=Q4Q0I1_LEIMA|nr:conserved hypothetical protein [Leishmania major strain Friedlin]CAG9584134.1 hypothetical_protein_-_conserved [Leishmania major strain Friedlin]CAJ09554.1 conserved hypothetical protein [Leishmania major strain Friedlin]|eukprot:XP_001687167.1 conserved hypothetical protein [Leishmania major strain Friedlin]